MNNYRQNAAEYTSVSLRLVTSSFYSLQTVIVFKRFWATTAFSWQRVLRRSTKPWMQESSLVSVVPMENCSSRGRSFFPRSVICCKKDRYTLAIKSVIGGRSARIATSHSIGPPSSVSRFKTPIWGQRHTETGLRGWKIRTNSPLDNSRISRECRQLHLIILETIGWCLRFRVSRRF